MTWVEYAYADWGESSGYTPPNGDRIREGDEIDGLPAPSYGDDRDHSLATQWAQIVIGLAIQAFGDRGNGNLGAGPNASRECPTCGCAWTGNIEPTVDGQRRPVPCWFCHPQPAQRLILPGSIYDDDRGALRCTPAAASPAPLIPPELEC